MNLVSNILFASFLALTAAAPGVQFAFLWEENNLNLGQGHLIPLVLPSC